MSVLVYGARGAQGSAIVRSLLAAGMNVRILLRRGATNPFEGKVDVVRGDLDDIDSVRRANLGIDTVVLTLPNVADPAALARFGRNAIDAAKAAGASLFVWNARGVDPEVHTGIPLLDAGIDTESYLRASELPSICVRPTLYMGNLTGPWLAPVIVHKGVLAYPLPADFRVSWISWEDLAAYVTEAVKRPDLAGQTINVGGPETLTGTEVAATLSAAVGRPVAYFPVGLADFAAGLNATLGDGVGTQIAAVYRWYQGDGASRLRVDLKPALAMLPIRPTKFADWAKAQDWNALAAISQAA